MKRSWMILAAGLLAPLAVGCGNSANQNTPVAGGLRTPPPYSVVAAPKAPAAPITPVSAPRTQIVPTVIAAPTMPQPIVVPAHLSGETTTMRVPTPAEPTAPAEVHFQHAPDYTTMVGELHHNPRQNTWRLRYAGVGEEDRYGGSVTLEGVGRLMAGYKSGQTVRIEGTVVDVDSLQISPAYRVRDIHPMN